ncbi:uncharacterized protein LOC129752213 [Uranotaenia lowii]|uniref:uncharacterized protein LOC129752213 n=1 Tax=Uranotaenia lowii TaxID=190385 RepID=UPI00247A9BDA|nr:uncharacterized protein LOC129752213 [Uranotaenia lowii]
MADDLRYLSKKERILWNLLESLEDFLQNYKNDSDHGSIQPRLAKLDEAYDTFCDLRTQIEVILDDGEDDSVDEDDRKETQKKESKKLFKEFMNQYFSLKQQLLSKIRPVPAGSTQHTSSQFDSALPCHTRYPELTLPIFSGELSKWINFRDNFRSLIHENPLLNDVDKFNYLRTSLRDDALLQINQIQVSATNYGLAWTTLESKYENHKLIAQEHMGALFAAPSMRSESFEGLNALLTTFKINLQQLEKLGQDTRRWSALLAFMLSQKLDTDTFRLWETHHASKNVPSYEAMVEFLENQCSILQSTASRSASENHRNVRAPTSHSTVTMQCFCSICENGSHTPEQCSRFSKMRVIDRRVLIRRLGLCFNCLDSGHFVAECSRSFCPKCGQRHHFLLHPYSPNRNSQSTMQSFLQTPERPQRANSQPRRQPETQDQSRTSIDQFPQSSQSTQQPPPTNTPTVSHHTSTLHSTQQHTHTAILSTAVVKLADSNGNTVYARALLDNGSQISLITEELSKRLNFVRVRESLPVKGVGGATHVSKESVFARVLSCISSFTTAERKFFVLPRITLDLPQRSVDVSNWRLPSSISLADPDFYKSSPVDLVLGVSTFYDVLLPNQMRLSNGGPILQNSHLGWIIAGELPETRGTFWNAPYLRISYPCSTFCTLEVSAAPERGTKWLLAKNTSVTKNSLHSRASLIYWECNRFVKAWAIIINRSAV